MFKSRLIIYKSYKGKEFSFSLQSTGSEPSYLTAKVFSTKKPKAEISLGTAWFSEGRGIGGVSTKAATITDPAAVEMVRGAIQSDAVLGAMIDFFVERYPEFIPVSGLSKAKLARWWMLSQAKSASEFLSNERKERLFADKQFEVGQQVVYHGSYRHPSPARVVTITAERFEFAEWDASGVNGWRYSFAGVGDAPQSYFRKIEAEQSQAI